MKDVRELFTAPKLLFDVEEIALLSSDDLHTLSAAMSAQKEITLTRARGDAVVTACVKPAPPVWDVPMIVRVRVERPGILWGQCFASVEEMGGDGVSEAFPQRLQKLRERRRLNRKALGELCGLSKNIIGQYERGEKEPSVATLIELADYFEVSADYLLGRQNFL